LWYYLAYSTFKRYTEEFQMLSSDIDGLLSGIIRSDNINAEIRFEDLINYVDACKKNKPGILGVQAECEDGKGLGFWFPDAKEQTVTTIHEIK
jgi:hypothetical protein